MADPGTRVLSLVPPPSEPSPAEAELLGGGPGLSDVLLLQHRYAGGADEEDEQLFFMDALVEYQWARDVAGLASSTLDG
ncbi:hypothetical protein OG372_36050 [Streptomyces sp. NBC_01020]|uniref:hypothetical protein n=1 Tax=unclassified Streptomyces TaxID=2593676 RepID=UPI002E220F2A|nr:hypothetical protein OG372_36050 [Streptomyces sp. NBC_01020]